VRILGDTGPPVVLLHGLVGSGRFWGGAYDGLAHGRRLVVPDLLGFGRSERPAGDYGPDDHAAAVVAALDALGIDEPITIGAHSLGCVVALRLATTLPERVVRITGFSPPLYPDVAAARRRIGASNPMARLFALPGPVAQAACRFVCDHRAVAAVVARLSHPSVPPPVAADAVQHTWESYSRSVKRCLLTAEPARWLSGLSRPVRLVAGLRDTVVDAPFLASLAARHPHVTLETWPGDHGLPLRDAARCSAALVE
jgi:pimeloyl-ACP methyl ester carboxylesterase